MSEMDTRRVVVFGCLKRVDRLDESGRVWSNSEVREAEVLTGHCVGGKDRSMCRRGVGG
jgi:hypothetical protein